jgi:DNA-binding transcriptional ArsR family regulator
MKALKTIKDPEVYQLLADETRRKIIYLLRVKEMTASQLAAELNLTPQAVYHHIKKLLKGGLVELTREERCGHLIESHYRATAELFSFSHGKTSARSLRSKSILKEQMTTALNALKKLGFNLQYDDDKISRLVDAENELEQCCTDISKLENAIYEMEDLDLFAKKKVAGLAKTLSMSENELSKQHENRKKFRELLTSLIGA